MNKCAQQSWVTTVQNDSEALQAWSLAVSLKNVYTNRKLTVIVSQNVSPAFTFILRQEFDLVVDASTLKQASALCGVDKWRKEPGAGILAQFWAWTLKIWNRCVHIPPNSLVLENCDSIFEHGGFSAVKDHFSFLYTFEPDLNTFQNLFRTWNELGQYNSEGALRAVFRESLRSKNHILDNSYFVVASKDGHSNELVVETPKILAYLQVSPWAHSSSQWLKHFTRDIHPRIQALDSGPVKTFLVDFVAKQGLPKPASAAPTPASHTSQCDEEILQNSISIVGLSCRFPESNNADEFWKLLAEGRDGVHAFPAGRKNTYATTDIEGVEGGYLKCSVDEFDAKFFGISPREAQFIDPQQRLLLEVIWEALEHAGIAPGSLKDTLTGSYLGIWQQDYESYIGSKGLSSSEFHHRYLGNAFSATSSRISYFLGLLGPNIAVESGCSSSLSALHLACDSLRRGEISMAISSGVNLTLGVAKPLTMDTKTIVLSKDYRCKTFDESADGFVRAEGCGALILKRTTDALRDGDNILAVIRGSALNNDGAGTSFGTPNAASQEKVFRQALKNAGVRPADVSYVEAHGTGTAVGDPIEMHALSQVYSEGRDRNQPVYIASVKTNIGHAESAAGIAGLIKTILALQHRKIPPHLNLKTLNPHIDLGVIPAIIPSELTDWVPPKSKDGVRLAAVSSFSMSGTNVHVILQEPPEKPASSAIKQAGTQIPQLITLSAKSQDSLQELASKYLTYLTENPTISLEDLAYTSNYGRAHNFSHRMVVTAKDVPSAIASFQKQDYPSGKTPTVKPKIGFLFTGQGCQYVGMGQNLYQTSAPFATAFEQCGQLFKQRLGVKLADVVWQDEARLQNTIYCQPAIFCVQYCLLKHWAALGVYPDFVLGHSVGEFAAAVAAGVFTLEQAMMLVIERSRLVNALPESCMLVMKCGHDKVKSLLKSFQATKAGSGSWVDVAAVNSQVEVVVSSTKETVVALEEYCINNHVKCQKLASSHAFHSRAMDSILPDFELAVKQALAASSGPSPAMACTFISGTKAKVMEANELLNTAYWTEHLRHTVRFSDAIQVLGANNANLTCNILLEIGPQPILLGLAMANLDGKRSTDELLYCPSLRRAANDTDWNIMLSAVARLYIAGVDLDWSRWYAPMKRTLTKLSLPTYAFDRQKYWYNQNEEDDEGEFGDLHGGSRAGGFSLNTKLCHPVLGRQIPSPLPETVYCQSISTVTLPYVVDHKVGGKIILPGAVYLEAALAVGKELLGPTSSSVAIPLTVQNLSIEAALEVEVKKSIQMQTVVSCAKQEEGASGTLQYAISFHRPLVAGQFDNWKRHATATFLPVAVRAPASETQKFQEILNIENAKARLTIRDSIAPVYENLAEKGIEFGPQFQSIAAAWTSATEVLTMVQLPMDPSASSDTNNNTSTEGSGGASGYICHPIVIDAMFQTFAFGTVLNGTLAKDDNWLRLPLSIRKFTWMGRIPATQTVYLYSASLGGEDGGSDGVICLYDETGAILAVLEGLELIKVSVDSFIRAIRAESVPVPDFYQENWTPRLGVTQLRHDLGTTLANVTINSDYTAAKIKDYYESTIGDTTDVGRRQTNLMCFYYIVKCVQECSWPWPTQGEGGTVTYDLWKGSLGDQLKDTRIHYSFMAALAEEGYLELGERQHRVLRPLPSIAECQEAILKLREQIPSLIVRDIKFYEFSLHCSEQLAAIVKGKTSPLSVLFPADASKVGASRFYQESETYTIQSEVVVSAFADLVGTLIPPKSKEGEPAPLPVAGEARTGNILRILEVGAGTGATSAKLIKLLQDTGVKYQYTFTDISHQFLDKAQEQFGTAHMQYGILNIEQDPLAQGYCPSDYDIVLAMQVVHATANLEATCRNLQTLMRPHGAIMITEQLETRHFIKVSFALLEGWWRFNDFRTSSPIVGAKDWIGVLRRCGFRDVNVIQTDDNADVGMIMGRAPEKALVPLAVKQTEPSAQNAKTWIFFGNKSILSHKIAARLQAMNRNLVFVTPQKDGALTAMQQRSPNEYELNFENVEQFQQVFETILAVPMTVEGLVYLCIDDDPNLDQIVEIERFKIGGLLHFLQNVSSASFNATPGSGAATSASAASQKLKPKVFVLAKGIHYLGDQNAGNPANATAWGAFRSFINECRDFSCCIMDVDQDQDYEADESSVDEICAQFWNTPNTINNASQTNADKFVVVRGGKKYVHRLAPMDKPAPPLPLPINTERYAFINPASGSFSDIQIGPEASRQVISSGKHVEVAIRAVALNFRDLLCVLKPPGFEHYVKPGADGGYDVGGDISGVVVAVGDEVTRLKVGDEVFGFTTSGGIKSHTIVHESFLMLKPEKMTYTGAATLPVVFLTSYYCLVGLGKLHAKDRVLIHVATGGVGLSAIQIAKQVGATIYATAGSKRKRAYLRQHLGITNVYNSRSLDYGPEIMRDTNGAGVTIVINSLTSTGFKETTLDCCAKGAQFIEIGKLNIWKPEEVANLRPDVRYSVIDLASADESNVEVIQQTFGDLYKNFETEAYKPLPFTVFALERIRDAFYYFQEAKHIGKIVIKMPAVDISSGSGGRLVLKHTFFDPESTYLITGGLGGLGVEVTKWMAGTGARHIVLAGRNPPGAQLQAFLDQLSTSTGCEIVTSQTDVGEYDQCVALLDKIKSSGMPPLRGIFLASGVLADALVQNQSWEKFNSVFHPKVYGAWWLHKLTLNYDLEFFTMFSSMVAVVGMMGQTTHAAASRFLDSLAFYRVSLGLPGATINWGAWSDVGAAAFLKLGQEGLVGIRAFTPSQGIHALEKFMLQNYTQACVLDVPDWTIVQQFLNLGSFLGDLKSSTSGPGSADASAQYAKLAAEIKNCSPEEKQIKIQDYLEQILKQTLRLAPSDVIDPDQNFTELGVDSLMAMEMRNRLQGILVDSNKTLSINALQENRTLRSLSTHLANLLNSSGDGEDVPVIDLIKQDAVLPDDIRTAIEAAVEQKKRPVPPKQFKEILLTGATGFLGSHILSELLIKTKLKVHCLVRANSVEEGQARLQDSFSKFKVGDSDGSLPLDDPSRVNVITGNVGQDQLGLSGSPELYDKLAGSVDAVIHCAIKSNHLEPYCADLSPESLRSQNVYGMLNVMRFVLAGKLKTFCHASSLLAVTKVTESGTLTEDYPTIGDYTELLKNGYSISKFVSEILIGDAVRAGLEAIKVIRYPSIWGHSQTGFISLDNNFNHGWNMLTTCVRFRKFPYMDNTNGITLVPVDVAAQLTLDLLLREGAENGVYNMTTETAVTQLVMEQVMAERGIECEFLPMSQWRNEVFGNGEDVIGPENDNTLEVFRYLYEDDESGQLRGRQNHPLFARQEGREGPQVQANVISEKMARNVGDPNLKPLRLKATEVINKHLDYYFQDIQ